MLQSNENETEILLGNKQLLGIFFVVAILLGVAFTGGYMVGRGSSDKKVVASIPGDSAQPGAPVGGVTHSVQPSDAASDSTGPSKVSPLESNPVQDPATVEPRPAKKAVATQSAGEPLPLGAPKRKADEKAKADDRRKKTEVAEAETAPVPVSQALEDFVPQSGQTFLQVAAVGRDEAEAVAGVLHRKGFRAHAVPKPGNAKIFRVLIGPIHDAGDLSGVRDSLRKTGFREVIVQKY